MPRRTPVRRKRPTYGKVRKGSRYTTRDAKHSVSFSKVISNQAHRGKHATIIKKFFPAPAPTTIETGATFTSVISNNKSKAAPNGSFGFSYHFQLDQLPSYADFTAIYQWYKILWVKVHFHPLQNSFPAMIEGDATNPVKDNTSASNATYASSAPRLVVAPDHSSEALFASTNQAMEHDGSRFHIFNDGNDFSIYLTPRPTGLVGTAGSEIQILTPESKWITTTAVTVPHYGLRCFALMRSGVEIHVTLEMKVAFKGVKT